MFRHGWRHFEEDPFFSDHHHRIRQTFNMFGSLDRHFDPLMDPFALPGPQERDSDRNRSYRDEDGRGGGGDHRDYRGRHDLAPRDMFRGIFGNMNSMFHNMEQEFERGANDPNSYSYSQSSVMSYSSDGNGEPKCFQAHKATKKAPGGIKETQHAVRDSESGLHRMAIGHHIGDRGQVIERSLNKRTGKEERKQDFFNMDEEDVPRFQQEWEEKTRSSTNALGDRQRRDRPRHRAIEDLTQGRRENRRERTEKERDKEKRRHGDDGERRVRVQSRPVNRHAPRTGLD